MKRLSLFIYFFLITVLQAAAQQSFDKTAVKSVMKRVADWQIANPNKGAEHDDLDWTHAALYMGMLDWAELTATILIISGCSVSDNVITSR